MAVATGTLLGRYKIISPLGAGGMGEVYLAQDTQLNRRVALKFPTVKADEHHAHARFLREARAVSTLSHPHIAAIYDYGETDDGHPFIIMELVSGESLNDLLQTSALSLARAVEIIADVSEALAEAHHHGIIHRDIKPSNVMINERGAVKVLDFGLAKQVVAEQVSAVDHEAETVLETHTQSGIVVGTPLYLSPEQATGHHLDQRSDIFALGALLYECITGRSPFSGRNTLEIIAQVIHVMPPAPSTINKNIPSELDRITLKALAKEPAARYQSAEEMRADLVTIYDQLSDAEHHVTQRIRRSPKTHRASALTTLSDLMRRPRLSFLSVLISLLAVGLAAWLLYYIFSPKAYLPPPDAQRYYETGTTALRNGSYYQAKINFEHAINLAPKFALAHARLAEALMELDYTDAVKDELLKVDSLSSEVATLPKIDAMRFNAIKATAIRDFAGALQLYHQIAQANPDKSEAWVDLGRANEKAGDTNKAIESYQQATAIDGQNATAFLRLGILYGRTDPNPASAIKAFEKAEEIYQNANNFEGRAEVYYQRGFLYVQKGNFEPALVQLQNALNLAHDIPSLPQQVQTMLQLAYVFENMGHSTEAQQYADAALNLAQANKMENLTARAFVDLGNLFYLRLHYDEAEKYLIRGLDLATKNNMRRNEARARLVLGNVKFGQNKLDEALSYGGQALEYYQSNGFRKETSQALTLLARVNRNRGDYDGARQAFEQQLKLAVEANDLTQNALSHEGIGTVLARQEQYDKALEQFQQSYTAYANSTNKIGMGKSLTSEADMLWRLGRYNEAQAKLDDAVSIANSMEHNEQLLIDLNLVAAELSLSEGHWADARDKSAQAYKLDNLQDKGTDSEAKRINGLALAFSGDKPGGKAACEEALQLANIIHDPWLISKAWLALAAVLLEAGDTAGALSNALHAEESFTSYGQMNSEWRALLIAALASRRARDDAKAREYATRASDLFSNLEQRWGTDNFNTYQSRPDVQTARKQMTEILAASK